LANILTKNIDIGLLADEGRVDTTVLNGIQRVQVGRHTIYIGKFSVGCLPSDHFDLCLTDPPYGINAGQMSGRKGSEFETETDKNGWRNFGNLDWDGEPVGKDLLDYIRDISKNQIIWGGNYFADNLPASMGWLFWDKGQRKFSLADGELAWTSYKKALRVFEYSRAKANKQEKWHPTQKPVELMEWCLERAGEGIRSVIDPFGGSGTTLLACEKAGIACTMFEQIPEYAEIAIRRLEELIGTSTG